MGANDSTADRAGRGILPEHAMAILDMAEDAVISVDESQHIIFVNRGAESVFGYLAGELLGQPLEILIPENMTGTHRSHVDQFASNGENHRRMGERMEISGRRKSGETFPAEAAISRIKSNGRLILTAIVRDVSESKNAEAALRSSLRDKEILLKEIHHRVKNNLQVVSSLLGLQSRLMQDPAHRLMFQESQTRVHSMALVHEELYRSRSLNDVGCREYFRVLAAHIFRSYGVSSSRVQLRENMDEIRLDLDRAVPCGLIVNELLSNALKHAFPDGRAGEVWLCVKRMSADEISLSVRDNGVGLPPDARFRESESLGLRLVRRLAEQLGASVTVDSKAGTEVTITIPLPESNVEGVSA